MPHGCNTKVNKHRRRGTQKIFVNPIWAKLCRKSEEANNCKLRGSPTGNKMAWEGTDIHSQQ